MAAFLLYPVPHAGLRQGDEMSDIVERDDLPLAILVAKNVDGGVRDAIRRAFPHIKPPNMPDKYINRRAVTHPQDGCREALVSPGLHLCHHTCLCLDLRLPSLRYMGGRMGADGSEMDVNILGHTIEPVANVPFAQSRTRLHWQPHVLTQNRGGFMGALNI